MSLLSRIFGSSDAAEPEPADPEPDTAADSEPETRSIVEEIPLYEYTFTYQSGRVETAVAIEWWYNDAGLIECFEFVDVEDGAEYTTESTTKTRISPAFLTDKPDETLIGVIRADTTQVKVQHKIADPTWRFSEAELTIELNESTGDSE